MLKFILSFIPLVGTSLGAFSAATKQFRRFQEEEDALVAVATGILAAITLQLFTEAAEHFHRAGSVLVGMCLGLAFTGMMNFIAHEQNLNTRNKVFWAMLIHNLPEGILIGISLTNNTIQFATLSLIAGITLQNLMDGFVVSMPLISSKGAGKAVLFGVLSGIIEPIVSIMIVMTAETAPDIQFFEPLLIGFSFSAILMIVMELWKECESKKIVLISGIIAMVINFILG